MYMHMSIHMSMHMSMHVSIRTTTIPAAAHVLHTLVTRSPKCRLGTCAACPYMPRHAFIHTPMRMSVRMSSHMRAHTSVRMSILVSTHMLDIDG